MSLVLFSTFALSESEQARRTIDSVMQSDTRYFPYSHSQSTDRVIGPLIVDAFDRMAEGAKVSKSAHSDGTRILRDRKNAVASDISA